ncbi:MAG: DUF6249 domain-containing protein [Bacteroides sp.]|nr:DUF6249 domain-containing protein [Bacteroides sp.]MCM1388743.1 DUF6249 domain-containing protein [Bacteroides sp.]
MKKLTFFAVMAFLLMSCAGRHRSDVRDEVVERIEEVVDQLNDSSFRKIVINDNDGERRVLSDVKADSTGNIIVNINIPEDDYDDGVPAFVAPVALISVIGVFIAPVLMVFFICYFIYRTKRDRNRVIYESVVSGHQLPAEFYKSRPRKIRFQSAVAWLAWSIGLFAFFMIVDREELAPLMLIPFIIGAGKMAAFFMYDYKKDNVD